MNPGIMVGAAADFPLFTRDDPDGRNEFTTDIERAVGLAFRKAAPWKTLGKKWKRRRA